jgi:glycosyltransferase involved in cell wall biosynthesis
VKALFLYTELAPYVVACMQRLASDHGVDVHVVRWPVNAEAPFELGLGAGITVYDRRDMDTAALLRTVTAIAPDIAFVSGWVDKGYLKAARALRRKGATVVLCSDTAWRGGPKQWVAVAAARVLFPRLFSHAWVTGEAQRRYALNLGFKAANVHTGFYSADTAPFLAAGERVLRERTGTWPHRLLCVARYIPTKNQQLLCDAFAELCNEGAAGDWALDLVGTGELFVQVSTSPSGRHARIRHLGFVQADDLTGLMHRYGAFVLPSTYEPWGVVVHEQACAAQPLLLSDAVGARERFLQEGMNGHLFRVADKADLKRALRMLIDASDADLRRMAAHSMALGGQWSPGAWAACACRLMTQS